MTELALMSLRITAITTTLALLAGCAARPPLRVNAGFHDRLGSVESVVLVPPDVRMYRTAAGKPEFEAEWSKVAQDNLAQAMTGRSLTKLGFALKQCDLAQSPPAQEELQDAQRLFEAVVISVLTHTCGGERCPESMLPTKNQRFEYSLGPLPALAQAAGTDVLLFVYARNRIPSQGEFTANVMIGALALGAGMAASRFGAPAFWLAIGSLPATPAVVTAALVDARTGDILWFKFVVPRFSYPDLRDPVVVEGYAADAFEALEAAVSARSPQSRK